MLEEVNQALVEAGFALMEFNQPNPGDTTDVVIGCHSVGNLGHGIGPSIAWFNPTRLEYELKPSNMLSIELFAYTKADEFGGAKVRIPLEDDAIITERGIARPQGAALDFAGEVHDPAHPLHRQVETG